jgi:hypothetical protein
MRQRIITANVAISSATNVKATGHKTRPEIAEFEIERRRKAPAMP